MKPKALGVLVGVMCLLSTFGCARPEPGSYQAGPRDLVLQLVEIPGVVHPGEPTSLMPTFSLYGDGRVIVAIRGKYDGALPQVRQLQLSEERVQQLVFSALDAGVQNNEEVDIQIEPDASTGVMTLNAEGQFGWVELGPEVGGGLGDLRAALLAYADRDDAIPYEHDAIAVLATPTTDEASAREWPIAELRPSAERRIGDAWCTTYRRTGVEDVTATAMAADPDQVWNSGNESFLVQFRPMLPDETDCRSLAEDHRKLAEQQE